MRFKLRVIPEPESDTRSVLVYEGEGTVVMRGEETGFVHACGGCDAPLIVDVRPGQIVNLVFRCSACGAYNESSGIPGQN